MQCYPKGKEWTVDGWIPAFHPGNIYFKSQFCPEKESQISYHAFEDILLFLLYSSKERRVKELLGMTRVSYFSYSYEQHVFKDINIYIGNNYHSSFLSKNVWHREF